MFGEKGLVVFVAVCKAFSEPSAYNQVLFHKTCRLVLFGYASFFCIYCYFANFLRSRRRDCLGIICLVVCRIRRWNHLLNR